MRKQHTVSKKASLPRLSGNGDVCSCWHGEGRLRGRSGALNEMGWFWSWGVREAFWVRGDQKENAEKGKCTIF